MPQTNTNRIKIANPPLESELRTYLTADVAVAGTDLPVLATTGFVIYATGNITAFADGGSGTVTVTSAAHGLLEGQSVIISGTTNYNGTFQISSVTTNTFKITDTWVVNDATGTWKRSGDYYLVIGEYDIEKTEMKKVDLSNVATDATGFTVAALTFSHEASDPVTFMRYNQIKVYGAVTTGGGKVLIATIDIDCSKHYTEYTYSGAVYSYFYTTYYNSTDDEESAYSEEIASTSFTRLSCKRIIESGLRKAQTKIDQSPNGELNWSNCLEILEDGVDEIMARKRKWSFLHKVNTGETTTASTAYIDIPTDVAQFEFLIIDGNKLDYISRRKYDTLTQSGSTADTGTPIFYTEKNNKHYLYPTPGAAYDVIQEYYKVPATLSDLSTELNRPFVPILIYYCGSVFAAIRGNDKKSSELYKQYEKNLELQSIEYSGPTQVGDATEIERTAWEDIYEEANLI